MVSVDTLTAEYEAWVRAEGLPLVSADDQDPSQLTEAQADWLADFSERWDAAEGDA